MKLKFCLLLIFSSVSFMTFCQSEAELQKIQEREMQKQAAQKRLIEMKMDSAINLTNLEKYEAADKKFLEILANIKSVPSDFTFHFGKNSYFLKKYKQSVDWLNKYIQLKGTSGKFYPEALEWKQKAEVGLLQERKVQLVQTTQVLSNDYAIDCGPTGKAICPVCNGTTVIIKKDYMGNKYKTCNYCDKHGFLSCEDYNKLLRGELKPAN